MPCWWWCGWGPYLIRMAAISFPSSLVFDWLHCIWFGVRTSVWIASPLLHWTVIVMYFSTSCEYNMYFFTCILLLTQTTTAIIFRNKMMANKHAENIIYIAMKRNCSRIHLLSTAANPLLILFLFTSSAKLIAICLLLLQVHSLLFNPLQTLLKQQ